LYAHTNESCIYEYGRFAKVRIKKYVPEGWRYFLPGMKMNRIDTLLSRGLGGNLYYHQVRLIVMTFLKIH
jgi:hypothetical protein